MTEELNGRLNDLFTRLEQIEKRKSSAWMWDVAMKIMVPVVLALGTWMITLEIRTSTIESNRFTNADALKLESEMLKELPPHWLREDLTEIKNLLRSQDARLRALELKVK